MQIILISLIKCSCAFIDIDRTHRQIVNLAVIAIIIVAVNCIFCCVCFSYSSFLTGYIDREEGESMRLAYCYRFATVIIIVTFFTVIVIVIVIDCY